MSFWTKLLPSNFLSKRKARSQLTVLITLTNTISITDPIRMSNPSSRFAACLFGVEEELFAVVTGLLWARMVPVTRQPKAVPSKAAKRGEGLDMRIGSVIEMVFVKAVKTVS